MKSVSSILITFSICITFFSCDENGGIQETPIGVISKATKLDSLKKILDRNINYFGDSLLNGKESLIQSYINKYHNDSCGIIIYQDSILKENFEGVKNIGNINNDKKPDTIFVIPPFSYCDKGDSYSFFDPELPSLHTDSYCCHPDDLFSIGDIDEDGLSEICIFYSSCASRFKKLITYSLKGNEWKQIGSCTFDMNFSKPKKEARVRKLSKGKFEMLEIVDKGENKKWIRFSL